MHNASMSLWDESKNEATDEFISFTPKLASIDARTSDANEKYTKTKKNRDH